MRGPGAGAAVEGGLTTSKGRRPPAPARGRGTIGRLDRWPVTAKGCIFRNPLDFVLDFESTDRGRFRFEVSPVKPSDVVWVSLGGGFGSVLRWWIGRIVGEHFRGDFSARHVPD